MKVLQGGCNLKDRKNVKESRQSRPQSKKLSCNIVRKTATRYIRHFLRGPKLLKLQKEYCLILQSKHLQRNWNSLVVLEV